MYTPSTITQMDVLKGPKGPLILKKGKARQIRICRYTHDVDRIMVEFGSVGTASAQEEANIFVLAGDGALDKMKSLIDAKPSLVNEQDSNGYSPLMAAASYGHKHVLEYLISKEANVGLRDNDGDTCLHYCTEVTSLQYLIEQGADIHALNTDGLTALQAIQASLDEETEANGESQEATKLGACVNLLKGMQ